MLEGNSLVSTDQVADLAKAPQGVPRIESVNCIVVFLKEVWAFLFDIGFPLRVIVNKSSHNPIENACDQKGDRAYDS